METLSRTQLSTVAEVTLSYRPKIKVSQRPQVKSSKDIYHVLKNFWNEDHIELRETFFVILLNNHFKVMGIVEMSNGGFHGVVVEMKMVFGVALKACASSIVVAHNHPSGNIRPSSQDIQITTKLKAAGDLLELPVQDHLIVSPEGYCSLADEGYM